jgi:hypothetical protein
MESEPKEKINPKALNLERLTDSNSRSTLGFKCDPKIKLELANRAQGLGISLSEYVASIVQSYDGANQEIKKIEQKIAFYENDVLKEIFEREQGHPYDFINSKGHRMTGMINTVQDVYTIIIHSFKSSRS